MYPFRRCLAAIALCAHQLSSPCCVVLGILPGSVRYFFEKFLHVHLQRLCFRLFRTCDDDVAKFRIGLLSKLQELGGPDVLLGLQKVGVDISGVEINTQWCACVATCTRQAVYRCA